MRWLGDRALDGLKESFAFLRSIITHSPKQIVAVSFPLAIILGDVKLDELDSDWVWIVLIVVGAGIANTVIRHSS